MSIHILLVDDHTLVREALKVRLEKEDEFGTVVDLGDVTEAVEYVKKESVDIILMDISLKNSVVDGVAATKQILAAAPEVKVLGLSFLDDLGTIKRMLVAGASGYVLKGCSSAELVEGIKTVVKGEHYFSDNVRDSLLGEFVASIQDPELPKKEILTDRELEVLKLVARGFSVKQIAAELEISVKTVGAHRTNIMNKIGIFNDAGLTRFAIREGFVDLNM